MGSNKPIRLYIQGRTTASYEEGEMASAKTLFWRSGTGIGSSCTALAFMYDSISGEVLFFYNFASSIHICILQRGCCILWLVLTEFVPTPTSHLRTNYTQVYGRIHCLRKATVDNCFPRAKLSQICSDWRGESSSQHGK